jgi:hypothetical protein
MTVNTLNPPPDSGIYYRLQSRLGYFGIGPVLVSMLFALTLTTICWTALRGHEKYPDPVAGAITWSDIDKSRDMHALMLLVGSAIVLTVGISALCREVSPSGTESDAGSAINQLLLFSLVPAGFRLAVACLNDIDKLPPLRYVSLFPLGAVVVIAMLRRFRETLTAADVFDIAGAVLLTPLMAWYSSLAIAQAIVRLAPQSLVRVGSAIGLFSTITVSIAAVVVLVIFFTAKTLPVFRQRALRCLMVCQYPLPLLLFYLLPPPLIDLSHQFRNPYPTRLVITLAVLAVVGAGLMYQRFRVAATLARAISPIAVAVLSIFILCETVSYPTISPDFFHSGEELLPWQQLYEFHKVPYVDFAPVHGLMENTRGALDQLFFDGTMANHEAGKVLLQGFAAGVTALAACELLTPVAALFLLFAVLPELDRMYFVAAPLFVIASPRLLRLPVLWLIAWLVMGFLACGYNAAMGPAFVLGTLPVFFWQTFRAFKSSKLGLGLLIVICGIIAGVAFTLPLPKQILLGFIKFILDNQWTNEAANGIAWAQGAWKRNTHTGIGSSQVLWELLRYGWIPAVIAAAAVFWKQWSKPPAERNASVMVLAISIPPVLLLSCLWVIERIDSGYPGRSASLTTVALMFLVPALLFLTVKPRHAGAMVLMLAVFFGIIYPNGIPSPTDPDLLVQKPTTARPISADTAMFDGPAHGLPRIGQVVLPTPDFTPKLLHLKRDLADYLKPGETYFDLSDEPALYYYLDMPCPVQYAVYVAVNARLQAVMMKQLKEHPVPVVLVSPAGWLDNVNFSLRCYQPYHDYVLKYVAVPRDEFIFLIDPARAPSAGPLGSEAQLQILDSVFRQENLLRLPIAWGDSWKQLRSRFDTVAQAVAHKSSAPGALPSFTCTIPAAASAGENADFVRLHCDFTWADPSAYRNARREDVVPTTKSAEPQLALTWTNADGSTTAPVLFKGQTGNLIVPLGAYPRWLLGHGHSTLTITLQNPGIAKQARVSDVEFLRLKPM